MTRGDVLVRVPIAVIKHQDQSNLERTGFVWFLHSVASASLREDREETQEDQKPGGRN